MRDQAILVPNRGRPVGWLGAACGCCSAMWTRTRCASSSGSKAARGGGEAIAARVEPLVVSPGGGGAGEDSDGEEVVAAVVTAVDGTAIEVMVQGAAQRRDTLESKKFANGGYRSSLTIAGLQPRGSGGLQGKIPKRRSFGEDGAEFR